MQAQSLKGLIDQAETREGYIGGWRGILYYISVTDRWVLASRYWLGRRGRGVRWFGGGVSVQAGTQKMRFQSLRMRQFV
jgi:hypothetical protein